MADDIRYIKQLKSRYNEIQYHKDNVVAIKFSTRTDGLKGFDFLNYEPEDELIKPQDKATKADEDREIINLIRNFDYTVALIAEELKPKFGADVELSTYYQRIKKRIQRLKSKGLIEDRETEPQPVVLPIVNVAPESHKVNVPKAQVNNVAPEVKPRFKPEIQAILDEQQNREDAENLQAFTELMADIKNRSNTTAI
jgi:hypothetical protein